MIPELPSPSSPPPGRDNTLRHLAVGAAALGSIVGLSRVEAGDVPGGLIIFGAAWVIALGLIILDRGMAWLDRL
jgi:hypothetical protein